MPPVRQENWTSPEYILSSVLKVLVQHGPTHVVIEFFAFDFWCIGIFYLLPGSADDVLVIAGSLPMAETFHFRADTIDQIDHHVLEFSLPDPVGIILKSLNKLEFVFAEVFWYGLSKFKFEWILFYYPSCIFLDQREKDHCEDPVHWAL